MNYQKSKMFVAITMRKTNFKIGTTILISIVSLKDISLVLVHFVQFLKNNIYGILLFIIAYKLKICWKNTFYNEMTILNPSYFHNRF